MPCLAIFVTKYRNLRSNLAANPENRSKGTKIAEVDGTAARFVAESLIMFRSASLVALVCLLALDILTPIQIRAFSDGTDGSAVSESSVTPMQEFEGQPISESSVLLVIGVALIGVARLSRR